MKRCGGRYDKYLVGKRLLNYIEIPTPEVKTDKLPMVDRLEAIVRFTKLLERSDSETLDYINRILIMLKEAESMILNVFTRIGVRLSVANAYQQLIALNPNDPYAKHKAAGSLGGAVNGAER